VIRSNKKKNKGLVVIKNREETRKPTEAREQQNQQQTGGMSVTWEQEIKSLMNIHENWTSLQVKAMQAGMTNVTKQRFDEYLDQLTTEINLFFFGIPACSARSKDT